MALAGSFVASAAIAQLAAGQFSIAMTLAALCAVFAGAWSMALISVLTPRGEVAEAVGLVLATMVMAPIVAAAGPGSPFLLLAAGLCAECYWIARTRKAAMIGAAAVVVSIVAGSLGAQFLSVVPVSAAAGFWGWLTPGLYLVLIGVRSHGLLSDAPAKAPDGIAALSDCLGIATLQIAPSGEIVDASLHSAELLELPRELMNGKPLFDRIHIADRVAYLCALSEARQGTARRTVELKIRVPNGGDLPRHETYRHFIVELSGAPTGNGGVVAVLRANDDVFALRRALKEAKEDAAGTEVAKSRFLAAVSHELRTPLNAVIGFSDMMLEEIGGPIGDVRRREYLGLIRESGHHLLSVVNSILDVSKIESGAYTICAEPVIIRDAITLCGSMMEPLSAEKSITLDIHIGDEVDEVVCDRRAVQQIVLNLVSNAIKFTPEDGRVSIDARRCNDRIILTVTDTGIGISAEDLGRIGQPFMQVQNDFTRKYEGTGLGLSLVKGLVRLHEGEMSMESMPGEGTRVTVSLPVDGPVAGRGNDTANDDEPRAYSVSTAGDYDEPIRKSA